MMRALWTASSGMIAQQLNVDIISNNLANVNTTSYKKQRAEFKDLLYATMDRASIMEGTGRPVGLQVGQGTTVVATVKNFEGGPFEKTDNPAHFALDGDGFFMVQGPKGDVVYTRDGSFAISPTEDGKKLTTAEGYAVLDSNGEPIILNIDDPSKINVDGDGNFTYVSPEGTVPLDIRLGVVSFPNREGLENLGKNFYAMTSASGEPLTTEEGGAKSVIWQRNVEASNVQVVEEMVKLIVAQRAYEINSKAIQSSDEMLGIANNMRR